MNEDRIATQVVDAAISIHKALGPGLLESVYVAALQIELTERGLRFARELPVQAFYRDQPLGVGYRADLVIENMVLVEVKSVQGIEPIHVAQLLTYLKLGRWKLGLLLNFNTPLMKNGIRRVVHEL